MSDLVQPLRVAPGRTVELRRDYDLGYTGGLASKAEPAARLAEGVALLLDYQDRLSAQNTFGAGGPPGTLSAVKDSTIKHVMSGLNPQGVEVRSFKQPSREELQRDFLWRYQRGLPERGRIGIFNRSHYEEVLVVRVRGPGPLARRLSLHRRRDVHHIEALPAVRAAIGVEVRLE